MTPNIDCHRVGVVPNLNPTSCSECIKISLGWQNMLGSYGNDEKENENYRDYRDYIGDIWGYIGVI